MHTTIGSHGLALVSPQDFSVRMSKHWSETLKMPTYPALQAAHHLIAEEFQRLIINNSEGKSRSVVLPLPTGSGKTQGTCLYASMQADLNQHLAGTKTPVGIVIITRLIEDADAIADEINKMAGRRAAVAHHTKNKAAAPAVFNSDVLVICHQAFLNAAKGWRIQDRDRWHHLSKWAGGDRKLYVIDEALANVVESHEANPENLATVLKGIPQEVWQRFPGAIKTLETAKRWLEVRAADVGGDSSKLLWTGGPDKVPEELRVTKELKLLREALQDVEYDPALFKDEASTVVTKILQGVEDLCAGSAYYFKNGDRHSINGATYLLPPDLPGVVITDATAPNDVLYNLLGTRVHVATIPPNVRDYSSVKVHVGRTSSGMGKRTSDDRKHLRLPRLAKHLSEELAPGRSLFLCVHEHSQALAETFGRPQDDPTVEDAFDVPPLPSSAKLNLSVGHWGAVDGKNTWQNCDVAVIFGLPFMDPRRAVNNVFATHGPQDSTWLRSNTHNQSITLVNVIMQRHLSTSVLQAINRICCRRVIDEQGRCPSADVYILLPADWRGDAILSDIEDNMPGIKVVPWGFEPDGPKVYAPRSSSAHAGIISLMKGREPGPTPFPLIQRELSLSKKQASRVKAQLRDGSSNIAKALREIGVIYHVTGRGAGSKTSLVKV